MDGRAFLATARRLLPNHSEADRRTMTGRAYYALLHEATARLLRWGFVIPPRESIHSFVRLRYLYAQNAETKQIGQALDQLVLWRNEADYQLAHQGSFRTDRFVQLALRTAEQHIALLDAIHADPARRTAAIAAIQAAWP